MIGSNAASTWPWLMSIVAEPTNLVEVAPKLVRDNSVVMCVLKLPFAVAVTSCVVEDGVQAGAGVGTGQGVVSVSVKLKLALRTALSVAFPGSAVP